MDFRKKITKFLNKTTPSSRDRNRVAESPSPGPLVPSTPSESYLSQTHLAPVLAITPPSAELNHLEISSPASSIPTSMQERQGMFSALESQYYLKTLRQWTIMYQAIAQAL